MNSKKAIKILLVTIYAFALLGVTGKLFFETQFDNLFSLINPFSSGAAKQAQTLIIGLSEPLISLSPLANDTGSRARLNHMYEALVRVSPDLKIEPSLAVNFGALDDLLWEFRLRPGVTFHNGNPLVFEDVVSSLEAARDNSDSAVRDLASSITRIEKTDENIFRIETEKPDPLFLQKLSYLYIFPRDSKPEENIGTGPYEFEKQENRILTLRRFEKYWGDQPVFSRAQILAFASRNEKEEALRRGSVDIVASVPPDQARDFHFSNFELKALPSVEVNFLMFNFDKTFRSRSLREAVSLALNTEELSKLTQGFAVPLDQFVGNGIFGYDPSIPKRSLDIARAQELVKEVSNFSRVSVTLDLPKGLEVFGANVREQLRKIGMDVTLNFLTPAELGKKIQRQESEFYFFGWKNDLGDVGDFLAAAVHSRSGGFGQFNGGDYRDSQVDRAIELSQEIVNQTSRLEKLRVVMNKITVEDIIGVPLFTPEVLYGVSKELKWKPRVDGFILAQEVKI